MKGVLISASFVTLKGKTVRFAEEVFLRCTVVTEYKSRTVSV